MLGFQPLDPLFAPHVVPDGLRDLWDLDMAGDDECLSEGFEFALDFDKTIVRTYSDAPEFLCRFVVFAQADGTGSFYAVWIDDEHQDENQNVADCPIVVFGSEGGIQVVASNLAEWLQILSCDVESLVSDDRVSYCKSEGHVPSDRIGEYQRWLVDTQGLNPIQDADAIAKVANERHQEALARFVRRYVDDF